MAAQVTMNGAQTPETGARDPSKNELAINYLFLRKTVGWIGLLLPVVLILGNWIIFDTTPRESMSAYYYTHMRDLFVGALCALGVFLIAYAGTDDYDRWVTNIAGACAIGVALCATKPTVCAATARTCVAPSVRRLSTAQQVVGDLHLAFAALTFIALGIMALRFTRPDMADTTTAQTAETTKAGTAGPADASPDAGPAPAGPVDAPPVSSAAKPSPVARILRGLGFVKPADDTRTPRQRWRAKVYRACGFGILACVALAALSNFLPGSYNNDYVLFTFEALAVFLFGASWFVKGQTLKTFLPMLRD